MRVFVREAISLQCEVSSSIRVASKKLECWPRLGFLCEAKLSPSLVQNIQFRVYEVLATEPLLRMSFVFAYRYYCCVRSTNKLTEQFKFISG